MSDNLFVEMGETEDAQDIIADHPLNSNPDDFFAKNAFRIVYQTSNYFLPQIKDLIESGDVLNLRPEYQRRLRWSTPQKSKLIESLLLNIPIPPIFLYESAAARYEVMDGQQRLNAVKEFLAGDFALSSLTVLSPLNGIRYTKCPPRIKRALDRSSISAVVLLLESDNETKTTKLTMTDIRRFIFDRLNTGGTKLNPQEIRNALNPGNFNELILKISRNSTFTNIFNIPEYVETDPNDYYENPVRQKNGLFSSMGDCQLVLRYFALLKDENIRGSMKSMLDRTMASKITTQESDNLYIEYTDRLNFLYELFDRRPFVLPPDEKGRERISAAVYDASMVALSRMWDNRNSVSARAQTIREKTLAATNNPSVLPVLTGQANTAQAVKDRIQLMAEIFS